ncbi:MAG TPA: UDP-N-acetylmuramoyl-L-alanine--D-glutamate ligase [Bacillales bacterium]|nr:UDP-N-acetylmuramoyl-L-alanine--D-glutamate ligase [Bacillales bacterium]
MKNGDYFAGKHCLILGLAKSGFAAAVLLHRLGAKIVVNDRQPLDDDPHASQLRKLGIEVIGGSHPDHLLDQKPFDLVIKNPGIPYRNRVVAEAEKRGIPIWTEPEIAGILSSAPFIAITGSNGKTTTTTLIGEILRAAGKNPNVAGNIGTVVCEVAAEADPDQVIVTELSSFQLLGMERFRAQIAVLLNVYDAHLDYHGSREAYEQAKAKIFANQTAEDFAVINGDDETVRRLAERTPATKVAFSHSDRTASVNVCDGMIRYEGESIIKKTELLLPGDHNLENVMAAVAVCKLYGVENEVLASVLRTFRGIRHRLQFVKTVSGRKFYNDSKATNTLATQKALAAFSQPVVLIAGGLDRGNDFDDMVDAFKKLKALVTYGETGEKFTALAKRAGMDRVKHVDDLEEAVPAAYELSSPGDVVLLSPACASWDQFRTFEERGDMFIDCVHKLR